MSKALFDRNAAMMVIAGLIHDPTIIHDQDNFKLTTDDFDNEFYKIVFAAILNLSMEGAQIISAQDIDIYIGQYNKQYEVFKGNDGYEFITNLSPFIETMDKSKFNFYYERLKKFTVLRDLEKAGIETKEFYNPEVDFIHLEKESEKINNISLDDIIKTILKKLNKVEDNFVSRNINTTQKASLNLKELFLSLKKNPEIGLPLDGEILNSIVRGARFGKMYINSAPSGHGKALPNSTILPTPLGFKKVEDIKNGDLLFDRSGKPTKVLEIFPQGELDVYKISFKDGRVAYSSEDHIWSIWNTRKTGFTNYTLKELIDKIRKNGYQDNDGCYRYTIPTNSAAQYEEAILPIEPYTLGVFLGDGSFMTQQKNNTLYLSSESSEIPENIAKINGWTYYSSDNNYSWHFKDSNLKNIQIQNFLGLDLENLLNKYSYQKFIPEEYLVGSIQQRLSLLQGLMDTDGMIRERGQIVFTTTSEKLAKQVVELSNSLGFIAIINEDVRENKYTLGKCYNVDILTNEKSSIFKLKRKKDIALAWENNGKRKNQNNSNPIINIEKLERKEEMTCFLVDNNEHLFLMNDYIVTHNTRFMIGNACAISLPRIENNEVVIRDKLAPVLFIATEQQADEIQTLILAYVSGVNEANILYGRTTAEEDVKIMKAIDLIQKYSNNFIIEVIPDPSIALIRSKIIKHIFQDNVEFIFYDYIFTSPGLLVEYQQSKIREDVALMMLSNTLKEIAAQYQVFVQSSTQLNDRWETTIVRNVNHIRGSKAIADKADVGMITVKLEEVPEEKQIVEALCKHSGVEMPNVVVDIYKNRRGAHAGVKLFRYFDYGTCRGRDLFLTTLSHSIIQNYQQIEYMEKRTDLLDLMTERVGDDNDEVD